MHVHRNHLLLAMSLAVLILGTSVAPTFAANSEISVLKPAEIACLTLDPCANAQPDVMIRRVGKTNTIGNGIYNSDGTNQILSSQPNTMTLRYVVYVQNDGDAPDTFTLSLSMVGLGIRETGFPGTLTINHGWPASDITVPVTGGTYVTPSVQPGAQFRMRVTFQIPAPPTVAGVATGPSLTILFHAQSTIETANVDCAGFQVVYPTPI